MLCDAVRHSVIVVSAESESSQLTGERQAVESSHDVNTATAETLAARLDRVERVLFGAPEDPQEFTVTEAARQLGVARRTVGNWATTGRCPSRMWRGQRYIPRQWVAEQLVTKNPINQEQDPR